MTSMRNLLSSGAAASRIAVLLLMALSSGCVQRQDQARQQDSPGGSHHTSQAQLFSIDPTQSSIRLRVYRDGPLARLGHNHVIVATALSGSVYRDKELLRSRFEVTTPVAELAVDRPADRAAAGPDFAGDLSEFAIAGTRENMLGPKLLAAEHHPDIRIESVAVEGTPPDLRVTVEVTVRGVKSRLVVPGTVDANEHSIVARGQLSLLQTQLGLTPFSVLGGGLRVRDAIDADYHLVAIRASAAPKTSVSP